MALVHRFIPVNGRAEITANGRRFPVSGATVDVPAGDAAAIHSDQAVRVMIVGATADRPTYNPGMINGGVPPSMYDTTLGKPIFSVPNTSPVRWVDITGAVV